MDTKLHFYRSLITPETRFMCDMLSPVSSDKAFSSRAQVTPQDPAKLLNTLKRHKLFPFFYHKWNTLPEMNNPDWQLFNVNLKQLTETNRIRMIQKSAVLVQIIERFREKGIPVISLKGPAMAQMLYGDVGMKASLDLDILIKIEDWDKALLILRDFGFLSPVIFYKLNSRQKQYLFNNFNHIELHRSDSSLLLELHWRLYSNKYMMEIPFGELYRNTESVELANIKVLGLNAIHQSLYLMAHGGWHQWSRLDWLHDFTTSMLQQKENRLTLCRESERLGLKTIMSQSCTLGHLFFGTDMDTCSGEYFKKKNLWLVRRATEAIKHDYNVKFKTLTRFAYKIYQMKLKRSFRYKITLWFKVGTNLKDWEIIKLPESLFFVYFLIRPFLYFYRIICNARRSRKFSRNTLSSTESPKASQMYLI